MKKIIIFLGLMSFTVSLLCQNPVFNWAKGIGNSTASSNGYSIAVDTLGNVYTVGKFSGTCDFDPGSGTFNMVSTSASNDIFISKLDYLGNFVWAKRIGGTGSDVGYGITVDKNSNIYITGFFSGTVDFDPGAGFFNITSNGIDDIFVCKLNTTGNFVWAGKFGGSGSDQGFSITLDASGNIYTTGHFSGVADFDPGPTTVTLTSSSTNVFISKLDPTGNFVWAKGFDSGSTGRGTSIAIDNLGNVISTGYFTGSTDFDPNGGTNYLAGGSGTAYINKLDMNGGLIWAKAMSSSLNSQGQGLKIDGSDNIYTTGYYTGICDLNPGAGTFNVNSAGSQDIYISKLDGAGNFVLGISMGGSGNDIGKSIDLDIYGNIYTTGFFSSTSDFDPSTGTFTLTSSGLEDIFISKLDLLGNFIWAGGINGSNHGSGNAITISRANNILVTGEFVSAFDFDPSISSFTLNSGSTIYQNIFIANYAPCATSPVAPSSITGISTICSGSINSYSATAVSGATSYSWSLPGGWSGTSTTNTISATVGSSGTMSVTASNACGSSSAQTLSVTVNPKPTITVNSGTICSGSSFTMSPSGASTYTYSSGSAVVSPTANASYSVTGTSSAGCVSANTAVSSVTVNAKPTITVNSGAICSGQSFTMSPSGASTYTFTGGSAVVSPTTNTTYSVSGTSAAGCVSASSAVSSVTVNAKPTITVNSGAICSGNSFTMSPSGASTYTFSSVSAVVTPTANTSYSVTGTSTQGCVSASPAVSNVTVNALPTISVNSGAICSGQSFTMVPSGANTYTYTSGSSVVSPTSNSSFSVSGTSTQGCVSASPAVSNVMVNALPSISAVTSNTLICTGETATLTASGASSYTFNPGGVGASVVVSPTVTSNYTVSGTDANGCNNTTVLTQSVSLCTGIQTLAEALEANVFPNPFKNKITITVENTKQTIQIFNALGSLIQTIAIENQTTEIDLTHQPSGMYFIRIGSATKKLIKE